MACESSATHDEFTRVHSFNFNIPPSPYSSLLLPVPFPSSTRNEGRTDYWLRQWVYNTSRPLISAALLAVSLFFAFHFSFFVGFFTGCLATLASVATAVLTPRPQSRGLRECFPTAIRTMVHTHFYPITTGRYADLM